MSEQGLREEKARAIAANSHVVLGLLDALDVAEKALKFYALSGSHLLNDIDSMGTVSSSIDIDGGDKAIDALAEIRRVKGE